MSTTMQLRFQKVDPYNNSIFIVSKNREDEEAVYTKLSKFHENLTNSDVTTFLPIYSTSKYATIRFKKNTKFTFEEGCIYSVEFTIRKSEYENKKYVSCFVNNSTLVAKAVDYGEVMSLD